MSRSRETVRPVYGSNRDRPCSANKPADDDKGCFEQPESRKPTLLTPEPIKGGVRDLVYQCHEFLTALWLSPGRHSLALLTIGMVLVVGATAAAQVGLNAWNRPFYEAIANRNLPAFLYQLLVFLVIAGGLLTLNVVQAWLREMTLQLSSAGMADAAKTLGKWLTPWRPFSARLALGENGVKRGLAHSRRSSTPSREFSADLGIGLLQASLLLLSFLAVLWTISGALDLSICGISLTIPGYMVWCAVLYAASGSWLTWRVGRPLVDMNSRRYQRESEFRFALFQANQQIRSSASLRDQEGDKRGLGLDLDKVLVVVREIVDATAKLTWITAGYGWISIVAPIVIASPAYFSGRLSFGELMVVVGGFSQVNQSLRWFVDNFALLAEWRAVLLRVIKFREALFTSEIGWEQEVRAAYLKNPADHPKSRNGSVEKGKRALLGAIERDVTRVEARSRCFH